MLKHYIRKYESQLMQAGVMEAARRERNIQIGLEAKMIINPNPFERIYLPQNQEDQVDISPILALGAENLPDIGLRRE